MRKLLSFLMVATLLTACGGEQALQAALDGVNIPPQEDGPVTPPVTPLKNGEALFLIQKDAAADASYLRGTWSSQVSADIEIRMYFGPKDTLEMGAKCVEGSNTYYAGVKTDLDMYSSDFRATSTVSDKSGSSTMSCEVKLESYKYISYQLYNDKLHLEYNGVWFQFEKLSN